MNRFMKTTIMMGAGALMLSATLFAQFRGGPEWSTANADARRSGWMQNDSRISVDSIQGDPGFQLIYKMQFEDTSPRQLNTLSPPVLANRLITYKGFKALAFLVGSSDNVYSLDSDLGRMYWNNHMPWSSEDAIQQGGTLECPGGLTANMARPTNLPVMRTADANPFGARGGRGGPGGNRARNSGPRRRIPQVYPTIYNPSMSVLTVSSDGNANILNMHYGNNLIGKVPFIPANSNVQGLMYVDDVLYAETVNGCSGTPNGVWALDLSQGNDAAPVHWETGGASPVGTAGPVMTSDGTVYVATGDGAYGPGSFADSVVALDQRSLKLKDWFTPSQSAFTATPVSFQYGDKEFLVVPNEDGHLYLLDSASLGGADHHTPLAVSPRYTTAMGDVGALASWETESGTRMVAVPFRGSLASEAQFPGSNGAVTNGGIAVFSIVDRNGSPAFQPAWVSRDMTSPLPPAVVNGVVIALSSGEYRGSDANSAEQITQRSNNAVLYVMNAADGKEMWNSGSTVTSFAHRGGLTAAGGQVYFTTNDSTLWAFGVPMNISGF